MNHLIEKALASSYSYEDYKNRTNTLIQAGKTTGLNQSQSLVEYTKLNAARMKRWDKKYSPSLEIQQAVRASNQAETWLVLTEAWCGDAAHNVPILARIAAFNPNINFRLALRDQNLDLMDLHLTNDGRSIPKMIRLNEKNEQIGSWGPRPQILQNRVMAEKSNSSMPKEDFTIWLHKWYNEDAGKTLEKELIQLMEVVEV